MPGLSQAVVQLFLCFFFFFLVHSGVSFQSVHLMHSVVWVSVMYFSPPLCRFPWAKVHMIIPRFRILGLISHRFPTESQPLSLNLGRLY